MRFTKNNIPHILSANEGFKRKTYYSSRNSEYENQYEIKEGKLFRRSIGKTSWSDSHYDDIEICDHETTQRFLRKYRDDLNLNI